MKRRAFTLLELLVVIGILSLLVTILLPNLFAIVGRARQVHCRANLNAIGKAIKSYSAEDLKYPATASNSIGVQRGIWIGISGVDDHNIATNEEQAAYALFNARGSKVLSPSASLYLLVRTDRLGPAYFTCTADVEATDFRRPQDTSRLRITDFEETGNLSYSLTFLWNDPEVDNVVSPDLHPSLSRFAMMSDLSPVRDISSSDVLADDLDGNSLNHKSVGQNVLYGDTHVEWSRNNRAGINGDNIFTVGNDTVPSGWASSGGEAKPVDINDTVMCFYGRE